MARPLGSSRRSRRRAETVVVEERVCMSRKITSDLVCSSDMSRDGARGAIQLVFLR